MTCKNAVVGNRLACVTPPLVLTFIITVFSPMFAWATPITVPTDLNPGDHYRLAFVTSTTRDATSTNIADYNSFVAGVAAGQPELAALGTTWTAIASTATVDARDNTNTNPTLEVGVPIYNLGDARIASTNADLWDASIDTPIQFDETGTAHTLIAWTGAAVDGTIAYPLGASVLGGSTPVFGLGYFADHEWVFWSTASSSTAYSLYAISGMLTVVPEPGTMALGYIGAVALAGCMLRRRVYRKRL